MIINDTKTKLYDTNTNIINVDALWLKKKSRFKSKKKRPVPGTKYTSYFKCQIKT